MEDYEVGTVESLNPYSNGMMIKLTKMCELYLEKYGS